MKQKTFYGLEGLFYLSSSGSLGSSATAPSSTTTPGNRCLPPGIGFCPPTDDDMFLGECGLGGLAGGFTAQERSRSRRIMAAAWSPQYFFLEEIYGNIFDL